eukprot:TRINITY_DN4133_c0_g1_i1.p1 TRINITY_DN4133_c0_g1~~TRINITY_DN4133_c0_g1_i1.p1  ORF type:complete len:618 (+),score=142.26 TRINITY_DN4133_c0_g1_i1:26-1855(+)
MSSPPARPAGPLGGFLSSSSLQTLEKGATIKLRQELSHGVWLAEVNGVPGKLNISFVSSVDKDELKKKAKKGKRKHRKTDAEKVHEGDEALQSAGGTSMLRKDGDLVDLGPHPANIPPEYQGVLHTEVDSLKKALAYARMELDIILKSYHQDFKVSESEQRTLDPKLRLQKSPDEMIFEKMMQAAFVPTEGFKKNTPDVTGNVVEVNAAKAKSLATADKTSNQELALAPPGAFFYHDIILPTYNLGAVSKEDLKLMYTLDLNIFPYMDEDDYEYPRLLVMHMFRDLDLIEHFNIDEEKLWRFLVTISMRYRKIPFHSWFHAFNVTQTVFFFLTTCEAQHVLGPLEKLALLVGTLCHDADHPGLNNTFHAKASTRIANLHKKSTLENHHLLNGYAILSRPECNIVENLSVEHRDDFMRYLRDLILATDLALHGIILRNMADRKKVLAKNQKSPTPQLDQEDLVVVLTVLMKCGDLSNEVRPQKCAARWAQMVLTEFFAQSDKERELELSVTPFMDRGRIIIANEQINFITKLCTPLYKGLIYVFPLINVCMDQMNSNLESWKQRLSSFYGKDDDAKKKLTKKSIWERDQVKDSKHAKLSEVIGKQTSGSK